jgi:hypothetical protein
MTLLLLPSLYSMSLLPYNPALDPTQKKPTTGPNMCVVQEILIKSLILTYFASSSYTP